MRIVTIPGADVCACCGTHTRTTGQVGQIKILTSENYKGGVRLSIVCGARALEAAQAMRARQADIGALLSAKADQTAVAVHRVYDEYTALKFNHFGLCSQLFDALAAAVEPGQNAIRIVPGLDPDGLHRLAVRLSEATTGLCAALTPNDKGTGYCLAQAGGDVRALTKALNTALNGRGGGKPGICQGSCAATPEQVEDFLKEQPRYASSPSPSLLRKSTSPKGRGLGSAENLPVLPKAPPLGELVRQHLRGRATLNLRRTTNYENAL